MPATLTFLGHATFLVTTDDHRVLIDPKPRGSHTPLPKREYVFTLLEM